MSDTKFNLPKMPEFRATKNGYEIRTEILDMAKGFITEDYYAKFKGWEISAVKDDKSGQYVTTVGMPEFPGLEKILETAQKMYDFVNNASAKK